MTEPQQQRPLPPFVKTDPADLFTLFGRFFSAIFLMYMTIFLIFRGSIVLAALTCMAAVLTQRAAILLYRRLRSERAAALEAWEMEQEGGSSHAS